VGNNIGTAVNPAIPAGMLLCQALLKAIHTIDGLIEFSLLFFFVKIKTLYIMIVHGLYTPKIHD